MLLTWATNSQVAERSPVSVTSTISPLATPAQTDCRLSLPAGWPAACVTRFRRVVTAGQSLTRSFANDDRAPLGPSRVAQGKRQKSSSGYEVTPDSTSRARPVEERSTAVAVGQPGRVTGVSQVDSAQGSTLLLARRIYEHLGAIEHLSLIHI